MGFSKLLDVIGAKQYLMIAVLVVLGLVWWRWNVLVDDLDTIKSANAKFAANERALIDAKRDAEARVAQLNDSLTTLKTAKAQAAAKATSLQKQLSDLKSKEFTNEQDRKTIECLDVMAPDGLLTNQ